MQVGDGPGNPPVHLFGIRRKLVFSPQTRLHVADFRAEVKGSKSSGHGGCGVTVNEDQVGPCFLDHAPQTRQYGAGYLEGVLAGFHDVEIVMGTYFERRKDLVKHFPVLRRNTDNAGEIIRASLEFLYDRRHFYGFRAGPEYAENFRHGPFDLVFINTIESENLNKVNYR
jgi:hypothetical protein